MKVIAKAILHITSTMIITVLANSVVLTKMWNSAVFLWCCIPLYLFINIFPSIFNRAKRTARIRQMADGCELLRIFLLSTVFSIIFVIAGWIGRLPVENLGVGAWVSHIILVVVIEALVFWNGIIRIYLTSTQLGIRWRVWGAICGMIPMVNK